MKRTQIYISEKMQEELESVPALAPLFDIRTSQRWWLIWPALLFQFKVSKDIKLLEDW